MQLTCYDSNVLLFSHGRIPPVIPWDTTRRSQRNRCARRPTYVLLPRDRTGPQQSAKLKAPLQEKGSSCLLLKWTGNLQVSGRWISLQGPFLGKWKKIKIPILCTLRIKRDDPVCILWRFSLLVSSCRSTWIYLPSNKKDWLFYTNITKPQHFSRNAKSR